MILRTIFHLIGLSISHEYRHRGGSAAHDSFLCPNWLQSRPGSYSADPAVQKLAPFLQNRHRECGKHPCLVAIFAQPQCKSHRLLINRTGMDWLKNIR